MQGLFSVFPKTASSAASMVIAAYCIAPKPRGRMSLNIIHNMNQLYSLLSLVVKKEFSLLQAIIHPWRCLRPVRWDPGRSDMVDGKQPTAGDWSSVICKALSNLRCSMIL